MDRPAVAREATTALMASSTTKPMEARATAASGAPVNADWMTKPKAYAPMFA